MVEESLQLIQPLEPEGRELVERGPDGGEGAWVHMKSMVLARPHPLEDAGILQNLEVPGDRGRGDRKRLRQLRDRAVRAGDAEENFPPRRVGKRAENLIHLD